MDGIVFKRDGYDPLIDYIKGLCIIFVVLTHSMNRDELNHILFPYWGDAAVPIFLLIQVFHYYKNGVSIRIPGMRKLFVRILWPFFFTISFMFLVQFFIYYDKTGGSFAPKLYWDKRGPGAYYIFIYLEFSFLLPLLTPLLKRMSLKLCLSMFVIFSQIIEFISCITFCPDQLYRILFLRYFFIIFLGFLIATKGIEISIITIISGIVGAFFMYIFNYTNLDLEPLFYTSLSNWKYCHWICYIYMVCIFLWLLILSYRLLYMKIRSFIEIIGKSSYEIYLFQFFYYSTISIYVYDIISFINNDFYRHVLYIMLSTIICALPSLFRKKLLIRLQIKK